MKNLTMIWLLVVFAFAKAYSQQTNLNPNTIKTSSTEKVITDFFVAFHNKDTTKIRSMFTKEARLSSLIIRKGEPTVTETDVNAFLESLSSIPESVNFKEELLAIHSMDGKFVSTVSVPYVFKVNDAISHKGTNLFTLFYIDQQWKITAIADSRIFEN